MKCWQIRYFPGMISNWITFLRKKVQVGENSKIYGKVIIKGTGKIKIGRNCLINSSVHADPSGGDTITIFRADKGASLIIGNGCGLSNCAIVAQKEIVIHDDVYIGGNVTILQGVSIGDGAIIGAGSIVTKSVPPHSVCQGAPAKVVTPKVNEDWQLAIDIVAETLKDGKDRINTAYVQKRHSLGYGRVSRVFALMEDAKILGAAEKGKRPLLVKSLDEVKIPHDVTVVLPK